jgi:pyrroloquinoline quinone (PQQ) biosynthesis protein C/mannose-6-phosphate isomerase-like protein (cupin superfamily)
MHSTIKHSKPYKSDTLKSVYSKHPIWENPLLLACENNLLTKSDLTYLFSQYYFYSQNFTRLIAVILGKCDNDYYRCKLIENLWEESGGIEFEKRHSEIFHQFLKNSLNLDTKKIKFAAFSKQFFNDYFQLCQAASPAECAAILAFATEGIVARLYKIFKTGLLNAGILEEQLAFFNLHIACDDEHAETLKELSFSYQDETNWLFKSKEAIITALDIRDNFFKQIYNEIQRKSIAPLIKSINNLDKQFSKKSNVEQLHYSLKDNHVSLYKNSNVNSNINFSVDRINFSTEVLDPRVAYIHAGSSNEMHRHAHETVLLILSGSGFALIDNHRIEIKNGDIIHIPRWLNHQIHNTGSNYLTYFAVTDYGLTKRFFGNTEESYRKKSLPHLVTHGGG